MAHKIKVKVNTRGMADLEIDGEKILNYGVSLSGGGGYPAALAVQVAVDDVTVDADAVIIASAICPVCRQAVILHKHGEHLEQPVPDSSNESTTK